MDNKGKNERILLSLTLFMIALIIGYNIFFIPGNDGAVLVETSSHNSKKSDNELSDGEREEENQQAQEKSKILSGVKETLNANESNIKININTASEQELSDNLSQIGPQMAKSIVEYRERNGGFSFIKELRNIKKIGDKIFEKIKDKITV